MFPLNLQQGSRASSGVVAETRGSSLVVAGNSGFLESYHRGLRAPLELQQKISVPQNLQHRMQDSTGFHWIRGMEFWALLELDWYSGFLATCGGASC